MVFTGVCIIFLISAQKHRLCVLVRTASPRRFFLSENFQFLEVEFTLNLNRRVFVMGNAEEVFRPTLYKKIIRIVDDGFRNVWGRGNMWLCGGPSVIELHKVSEVHYENTPIQIYRKFYHQKMKIFR